MLKKIFICLTAATFLLGSVTAFAIRSSWQFSGYDISAAPTGPYAKIYVEVDEFGNYTGNQKFDGYAGKAEWKHDFYEAAYPHAEYARLYLDDVYTSAIKATDSLAPWEAKFVPDVWELKYPYKIYDKLYSRVNSGAFVPADANPEMGVYDSDVYAYSGKDASVKQEYKYFGFGQYRVTGDNQVENAYSEMSNWVSVDIGFYDSLFTPYSLSAKHPSGQYVVSDYEIAQNIQRYNSEYLTGPSFGFNRSSGAVSTNEYSRTFSSYDNYLETGVAEWYNQVVKESDKFVSVGWSDNLFELSEPYAYYQILIVDGVYLDGRILSDGTQLPYIYRYTGGYANPKVEWRFYTVEAEAPYAGYDIKVVIDQKTGIEYVSDDVRRNGKYGHLFGKAVYNQISGLYDFRIQYVDGRVFNTSAIDPPDAEFPGNTVPFSNFEAVEEKLSDIRDRLVK